MERTVEIGIIGLGLIGGSLAKSMKANNRHVRIVAHDRRPEDLAKATAEHVVDNAGKCLCRLLDHLPVHARRRDARHCDRVAATFGTGLHFG